MEIRHTIVGATGRAQLVVLDQTGPSVPAHRRKERPEFRVRLLPKSAHPSTAFAAAGDTAYRGSDLQLALLHIKAWTGLERVDLPEDVRRYIETAH